MPSMLKDECRLADDSVISNWETKALFGEAS